ncbi:MAG TPA: hypothetical protein VK174_16600 [Chitinophagales bacterium]|nr:hypothetical protein [Chitinophagales bacterium]
MEAGSSFAILRELGHFLEFIAAANAALIITEEFSTQLITKIVTPFRNADHISKLVTQMLNRFEESWKDHLKKHEGSEKSLQALRPFETRILGCRQNITELDKEVAEKVDGFHSKKFNYLCFVSTFYCLLLLVAIGFDWDSSCLFKDILFWFNLVYFISLGFYLNFKKDIFKPTYVKVSLITFYVALIGWSIGLLSHFFFPTFKHVGSFTFILQLECVLIPITHFIHALYKAVIKVGPDAQDVLDRYNVIRRTVAEMVKELEDNIGFLKKIGLGPNPKQEITIIRPNEDLPPMGPG